MRALEDHEYVTIHNLSLMFVAYVPRRGQRYGYGVPPCPVGSRLAAELADGPAVSPWIQSHIENRYERPGFAGQKITRRDGVKKIPDLSIDSLAFGLFRGHCGGHYASFLGAVFGSCNVAFRP
jgi:hypothetical protein